jgi:hypothetical protein
MKFHYIMALFLCMLLIVGEHMSLFWLPASIGVWMIAEMKGPQ